MNHDREAHRRAIYVVGSTKRYGRSGLLMLCSGPECGGAEVVALGITVADVNTAADEHIDQASRETNP